MQMYAGNKTKRGHSWIIVPLRLFLGGTFVYAGLQKLTDTQFFNPAASGYIGRQITDFAHSSPLQRFLLDIAAPHASLFGALVAYGELAIGLGTLLGLFLRLAACFGLLINLVFFLTATWRVSPYFYGSDIVFCFCWLTLLIAGPDQQVLPALDTWLVRKLVKFAPAEKQFSRSKLYAFFFGIKGEPAFAAGLQLISDAPSGEQLQPAGQVQQRSRRTFLWGTITGGTAVLALAWLAEALHLLPASTNAGNGNAQTQVTPTLGSPVTTAASDNPLPGGTIAQISALPVNSSLDFTLPSNDPGVLIHLANGQFVAYDAICTHAGCQVDYDPTSQKLICPCHGAAFDPARAAQVLNGPALTPLTSVPIQVDQNVGTVILK